MDNTLLTATLTLGSLVLGFVIKAIDLGGRVTSLARRILHRKERVASGDSVSLTIPKQTVRILPSPGEQHWWHMGSVGGAPAMQVSAHFNVTNTTSYEIVLVAAILKKPRVIGHVNVKDSASDFHGTYELLPGRPTRMSLHFWIIPPVRKQGQSFRADVVILDQFGNEHRVKGVDFQYR